MTNTEQKAAARSFIKTWSGRGSEKSDTHTFWLTLLRDLFGIVNPERFIRFEVPVPTHTTGFIDALIPSTNVLIEQKGIDHPLTSPTRQSEGTLLTPYEQAMKYVGALPYSQRPRYIVVCNFREFAIYDTERPAAEPEVIRLEDLETDAYRLSFLIDVERAHLEKEKKVSLRAGELVGKLYDALLKEYRNPDDPETLRHLNILAVRIVFCLYAEDAGLFGKRDSFLSYLSACRGPAFRDALIRLFNVLDTPQEQRDPYLSDTLLAFPYVNGGLFSMRDTEVPRIPDEVQTLILDEMSQGFNWSMISPTIFGGLFESTLNPDTRREGGMHYTSVENIHRVIDPLFMDDLKAELETILEIKQERTRQVRLRNFQEKIASLTFLDPAAGSGNFLTETYLSLRRLENKVIAALSKGAGRLLGTEILNPIRVSIDHFYGIEINDFAVAVARTALWIAEAQMLEETRVLGNFDGLTLFPLTTRAHIVEANALRTDWTELIAPDRLDYIIGNPPFVGARMKSKEQANDILAIFGGMHGAGNLDYVACWYRKCADFIRGTDVRCALVSTNSITQGEQVGLLWENLCERRGVEIDFAWPHFVWNSESAGMAHVHCVIVGFSLKRPGKNLQKRIFHAEADRPTKEADNINAYLIDAPNVYITSRSNPISDVPKIGIGNKPIDGGNYLFTEEEMNEFIREEPLSQKWFRPWYGAYEFINRKPRYCLWLGDCPPQELRRMPKAMKRVEAVREVRLASKSAGTVKLADTPTRFHVENMPDSDYLLIPSTSSERRKYIPIGFMDKRAISSNAVHIIPGATFYHFAVLTSSVHMDWMRLVCGRLKSDYRYSKDIVYNNFPWPEASAEQQEELEATAQAILDAREVYPEASLADLYDDLTMPPELRRAHRANDRAVLALYGLAPDASETEVLTRLFALYRTLAH